MSPKSFSHHYLKLRRISEQLADLDGVEVRRLRNGVLLSINHFERTILVQWPGSDWVDFTTIKKSHSLELMQCRPLTSLPEFKLSEVNASLRIGRKGVE